MIKTLRQLNELLPVKRTMKKIKVFSTDSLGCQSFSCREIEFVLLHRRQNTAICAAERPLMRLTSGHLARRTATQIRQSFEV